MSDPLLAEADVARVTGHPRTAPYEKGSGLVAGTAAGGSKKRDTETSLVHGADPPSVWIGTVPSKYRNNYARALDKRASPRQAIKAKCLECCAWQREEVRACSVRRCPLWQYRPFKIQPAVPLPATEPTAASTSSVDVELTDESPVSAGKHP